MRDGLRFSWRSTAAATGFATLLTFASLASGAARIDNSRAHGLIAISHARFRPALNLVAGDRVQRVFDLRVRHRSHATLVVRAATASTLTYVGVGVRIRIDRCSRPWRARGKTFRCRGRTVTSLRNSPALGRHTLRKLSGRRRNHLRLTLTLPSSAPNALQGQTARLVYKVS